MMPPPRDLIAPGIGMRCSRHQTDHHPGDPMAKGLDKKKETKKQPAKTLKEKRAAKNEKKSTRG